MKCQLKTQDVLNTNSINIRLMQQSLNLKSACPFESLAMHAACYVDATGDKHTCMLTITSIQKDTNTKGKRNENRLARFSIVRLHHVGHWTHECEKDEYMDSKIDENEFKNENDKKIEEHLVEITSIVIWLSGRANFWEDPHSAACNWKKNCQLRFFIEEFWFNG